MGPGNKCRDDTIYVFATLSALNGPGPKPDYDTFYGTGRFAHPSTLWLHAPNPLVKAACLH